MEIKTQKKGNIYDDMEIKCPYCFNTFHHYDVVFRTEGVDPNKIQERSKQLAMAQMSPAELDKLKKELENDKKYVKSTDEAFLSYWNKMGYTKGGALFENSEGYDQHGSVSSTEQKSNQENSETSGDTRKTALGELLDPIIGVTKTNMIGNKTTDKDGFVNSATDNRGNETDRRVCPHCHNKLPKDYGKYPVRFLSVVGISGAGKTVMLTQLLKHIDQYISNVGGSIISVPGGTAQSFIAKYKVQQGEKLPRGNNRHHFSPPVFLTFTRTENQSLNQVTLVLYDIAGEDCVDPEGLNTYGPFVKNSDGIIMLVDPEQVEGFQCQGMQEEQIKPQTVLNAMASAFLMENDTKSNIPIAVAYSKSDKLKTSAPVMQILSDAGRVFQKIQYNSSRKGFMLDEYKQVRGEVELITQKFNRPFYDTIRHIFNQYGFFAVAALGNEADKRTNEKKEEEAVMIRNLQPMRLEEPMLWLLSQWKLIGDVTNEQQKSGNNWLMSLLRR